MVEFPKVVQDEMLEILSKNINTKIVKIENVENTKEDMEECTDLKVNDTIRIGLRSRTRCASDPWEKDFTIRFTVNSEYKTEIDKITKGYIQYYIYTWVIIHEDYSYHREAILIEINDNLINLINKYKANNEFKNRQRYNKDGETSLTYLTIDEIEKCGALLSQIKIFK